MGTNASEMKKPTTTRTAGFRTASVRLHFTRTSIRRPSYRYSPRQRDGYLSAASTGRLQSNAFNRQRLPFRGCALLSYLQPRSHNVGGLFIKKPDATK